MENTLTIKNLKRNMNVNFTVIDALTHEEEMTETMAFNLMRLFKFVNDDNVLSVRGHIGDSIQELSNHFTELGYGGLRKLFPILTRADVIKKIKYNYINYNMPCKTVYAMNPWIFSKNNKINIFVLKMFENSKWKSFYQNDPTDRNSYEYAKWEYDVKERDSNKCVICGSKIDLEVHHLSNYSEFYKGRIDVTNGITLCKCHHNSKIPHSFHNMYGTVHNTKEQFDEYMQKLKETKSKL